MYVYVYVHIYIYIYTILSKVLGHPLPMKGLTTLVISTHTNLIVYAYNDILVNQKKCASDFITTVWTGPFSILT